MILYPTIELQNGRCVSLHRGRLEEPQIWHVDPVKKAHEFAEAGAEWIHITDFDAIAGDGSNRDVIDEIIRTVGIPVQLGGGFRTMHAIEEGANRGAGRIVLGTVALLQPDLVRRAAKAFPDQIALAIDVWQGKVVSDGWRQLSSFDPEAFLNTFLNDPLSAVIVTDIDAPCFARINRQAIYVLAAGPSKPLATIALGIGLVRRVSRDAALVAESAADLALDGIDAEIGAIDGAGGGEGAGMGELEAAGERDGCDQDG